MNDKLLVAAIGGMSIIVVLEGAWLTPRIQADRRFKKLKNTLFENMIKAIYFLGLPYLALITGLVPARFFGLKGLDFFATFNLNSNNSDILADILLLLGNILLTWVVDFGPIVFMGTLLSSFFFFCLWVYLKAINALNVQVTSTIYQSTINIIFDSIHWGFYRAIIWVIFNDIYLGVVGGLVLIAIEYVVSGKLAKFSYITQQQSIFRFIFAVITSIVFLFGQNIILITLLHFMLTISCNLLLSHYHQQWQKRQKIA